MLRIKGFFKPYSNKIFLLGILVFFQAITSLLLPYFMSDIVNIGIQQYGINDPNYLSIKSDYISKGIDIASIQREYILKVGSKMVLISIISALVIVFITYIASKIAAGVGKDLRNTMFTKIESFHNDEFDKFSSASLITRSTNDVNQIQNMLVFLLRIGFWAPIMAVGGIIMALKKSISLSWTIALAVICIVSLILIVFKLAIPKFIKMQKLFDKITKTMRQTLSGLMVVKAFNTKDYEINKFSEVSGEINDTMYFLNKTFTIMPTLMMLILNLSSLIIIWFGSKEIAQSSFRVGDMIAYLQFAMMIIMAFLMMSIVFVSFPRADVSANRIADVLDCVPKVKNPENAKTLVNFSGQITFDKVSFKYPEASENALTDISFNLESGETLAIVGSTGSGKTSIMNLLTKFYNLSSGMIYLDGISIDELGLETIRDNIAYIPQKSLLFKGSIKSNMKYANPDISEEEINKALEVAQAMEFVSNLENGIDSEVSQGGKNFSGGQKQRLTIARALCKKSKVHLFDDSFSALDFSTDKKLRKALREYSDSTIIIVAQRVNSIKEADKIIVLEEGKIVGIGKHKELLESCPIYREIALSQLSEEEIDG